ncbi:undecaprenyl-diphosphatase [Krasilnikovia cinnamomea]|uniref:Undecaprenyl-diphosphatase n=1 Tax=Krasilnikovia cinnamomea TaxID=349313 RepID=A0A4Q7ZUM9_9ACTN|nr:phosphatase PAP2 family protein [Krasilnikovia cinnamomea]RZU54343.1 undecaprenyl-diphosphatase [Krasilnikovia cinnamomea]
MPAHPEPPARSPWRSRRLDPDAGRGLPLTLATASLLLCGPFALLTVLVVSGWGPLLAVDDWVTAGLHGYALRHPAWVHSMAAMSAVFGPNCLRVATAVLVVWLFRRRRRQLAVWAAVTIAAGGLLALAVRLLVRRSRPDLPDPVARVEGYAFPSGHAISAALAAGVFLLILLPSTRGRPGRRVLLCVGAAAVAVLTGVSRVALGVHWSSDVLGGWVLAAVVFAATTAGLTAARARRGRPAVTGTGRRPGRR